MVSLLLERMWIHICVALVLALGRAVTMVILTVKEELL